MYAEFLDLCRAEPFRPFRVHTVDGAMFDVAAPSQVAFSPGGGMIVVVVSDARFEVLVPERIARCEVLSAESPPIPEVDPETSPGFAGSPGGISLMAFTATDSRRMVHFVAMDADGNPILSSAGTRWDVHAMEVFDNGRTLYLHHVDDLTLKRRIIIWPPNRATFESFAEAMNVDELQEALRKQGAAATSRGFTVPKGYFKSIIPDAPYVPPMPKFLDKHNGIAPDDPLRFVVSSKRYDAAPGLIAVGPAVTDLLTERVMFDLNESGWDATIVDGLAQWELTLRIASAPRKELKLGIDGFKGLAQFGAKTLPLETAERHLRNFPLHNSWQALVELLESEPRDLSEPEVVFRHAGGARVELWPGKKDVPPPFLAPRIVDAGGRAILDCRGTVWGALTRIHDSMVVLSLLHAGVKTRTAFEPWLDIDLFSHRVTSKQIEGSTCVAVLQRAVEQCRTVEWMEEELREWFGRGKGIPLP